MASKHVEIMIAKGHGRELRVCIPAWMSVCAAGLLKLPA